MQSLIDGQPHDHIPADDRCLRYGDGLFETMRVHHGSVPLWDDHRQRLTAGCHRLGIAPPGQAVLEAERDRLLEEAPPGERAAGVLRLQVSAGSGGRGDRRPDPATARRIFERFAFQPDPPAPARLHLCRLRLSAQPALAGLKHCNRLEYILARREWNDPGIADGLLLDPDGAVVEGTRTCLLAIHQGHLLAPSLVQCGVAGVLRERLLGSADTLSVPIRTERFPLGDWLEVDLALICNAVMGVRLVAAVGGHRLSGPCCERGRQAHTLLQALLDRLPAPFDRIGGLT